MRGLQLLMIAAVSACLAGGCGPLARTAASPPPAVTAQRHVPAPANPDLGSVLERFYQQVEGGHWRYAHAMLSTRYGALVSEDALRERYDGFAFAEIVVGQPHGTTDTVLLTVPARRGAAARTLDETLDLVWDGDDWKIDRIARRPISALHTR